MADNYVEASASAILYNFSQAATAVTAVTELETSTLIQTGIEYNKNSRMRDSPSF